MSTSYPGALDSYTPKVDGVDTVSAAHVNDLQDAVEALEAALGTNPASGFSSVGAALVSLGGDLDTVEAGLVGKLSASGGTMSGDLDMGSHRITNLAEPQGDSDAATLLFVESLVFTQDIRWRDDFLGDRSSRWTLSGTGGSYSQNSEVGGTGDLSTGATSSNGAFLSFNGKCCTSEAQAPNLIVRAKLSSLTEVKAVLAGLYNDANNRIEVLYDVTSTAGNFKYRCVSGGTETLVDSGVAADTAFHVFEIEVDPDTGDVLFRIDDANEETLTTNIPTALLEPRIGLETKEAADKRLTVDVVHLESGR